MGTLRGHFLRMGRDARTFQACRRLRNYNPDKFGRWWRVAVDCLWAGARSPTVRANYLCGSIIGALQAKKLGLRKIYLIEFGVATGGGFRSLVAVGDLIRSHFDIGVEVVGFDNRDGLPAITDYRDHPEIWSSTQFAMDDLFDGLDDFAKANGARLIIGDIADTLPAFLRDMNASEGNGAALAFCSIDVDLYSSTVPITAFLEQVEASRLLPATVLYVDDVFVNWTYSRFAGEGLAIDEFNNRNDRRKIELKHKGHKLFALHAFDHEARREVGRVKEPFEIYYKDLCNAVGRR
jgi:hypothetical protein